MVKPTSKPVRDVDEIEKLCGGIATRPGRCEEHGDFVDVLYQRKGEEGQEGAKGWGGCPECSKVQAEQEIRDAERNRLAEVARERAQHYLLHAGIAPKFRDASFENYLPVNDKAARQRQAIMAYADLVSSDNHDGKCLILSGDVGCGKTHLATALIKSVIWSTAQPCMYVSFDELVAMAKETFAPKAPTTERELYRRFTKYRLVVIDEVGMQNFTEFEQTVAYKLINARYLQELPTVLATNVPANNLKRCIGERAVDRLRENGGKALAFDWTSYRDGGAAA